MGLARLESADLRASNSDALLRPVPRRAQAGLTGAHPAPAPGILSVTEQPVLKIPYAALAAAE